MHDGISVSIKTVGVAVLTVLSAVWTGAASAVRVVAQSDPLTAWVPGVATLLGLAALVWRLVVDTRNAERQDRRFERLIDELQAENERLRRLLADRDDA